MKTNKFSSKQKHLKLGLIGGVSALIIVSGSIVFALPPQAASHAQAQTSAQLSNANDSGSARLAAAQLRSCQNRENAINNILNRISTREQNQLTLFGTIATRVENFYTSKGNAVSNYDQLVAAIDNAKSQAQTDLSAMQSNNTFSCSSRDPKGIVTVFQGYLKTEIADLQNYRTAVKNLIVAVAKANGVAVSDSSQSNTSTQGGQQ